MPAYCLYLFGVPRLEFNSKAVSIRRRKTMALLAHLAVTGQAHSREALATMMWPEHDQSGALANLRRDLSRLRNTLGEDNLEIDRMQVSLDPQAEFWVDVVEFKRLITQTQTHNHAKEGLCQECATALAEALTLYSDDFMAGFTLPDSPQFDEWQFFEADGLRQSLAEALEKLIQWHVGREEYEAGIECARRWLALDFLHEPAHRVLMQLYAWSGKQAAALRQYKECRRILGEELGLEPEEQTVELYEAIKTRQLPPPQAKTEPQAVLPERRLTPQERFVQEELLEIGGHGEVYLGRDLLTERKVVIKRLKAELLNQDPSFVERFVREGEALRQLNHPNIISFLGTLEQEGKRSIVVEYVPGGSLRKLLDEQGQLPLEQVLDIALELADALSRAHHLGIIHRDLKPDNVLLAADGTPRLTDFGMARLLREDIRLTQTGMLLGSPAYMSPEALKGEELDPRSDIWSFGVLLYEMLCGRLPFEGEQLTPIMLSILQEPLPEIELFRPDVPSPLANLLRRMLLKERDKRIASIRQVAAELEAIRAGKSLQLGELTERVGPEFAERQVAHNLPAQTTPFIGREEELAEITKLLRDEPGCRLLTLIGPGGIGKTRLALQAAGLLTDAFSDGVYFVPLASVDSAEHIPSAIANAVNLKFSGPTDPQDQLLKYLRDKRLLLFLDNFEQLLGETNLLSNLLSAAPSVVLLVTSRERLNLQGEWIFEVDGMSFPPADLRERYTDLASLEAYSAVSLFLDSARRTDAGFELAIDNIPHMVRICQLLDGMPLGLVLAAPWVRVMGVQEIADEIERNIDFLSTAKRDIPERHRSLRGVLEQSWQQLSGAEKELLSRLSIFQGGCSKEAAEQVAGATLGMLAALVDKSLLHRTRAGRYEMHELIRQFALEQLSTSPAKHDQVKDLHSEYYGAFIWQRDADLLGRAQGEALKEIAVDIDNVRAAWRRAIERRADQVLEKSELRQATPQDLNKQAYVLFRLGNVLIQQGKYTEAGQAGEQSYSLFIQINEQWGQAAALAIMATSAFGKGQLEEAQELLQTWMSSYTMIDNPFISTHVNEIFAKIAIVKGEYFQARTYLDEIRKTCQEIGYRSGEAFALRELARLAVIEGDYELARDDILESLAILNDIGSSWDVSSTQVYLGDVLRLLGDDEQAKNILNRSLAASRAISHFGYIAICLSELGNLAYDQGEYQQAGEMFKEALAIWQKANHEPEQASTLRSLGYASLVQGEKGNLQAKRCFEQGLQLAVEHKLAPVALDVFVGLSDLLVRAGEIHPAVELLGLVENHPASTHQTREKARQQLIKIETDVGASAIAQARARGQAHEWITTADRLVRTMARPEWPQDHREVLPSTPSPAIERKLEQEIRFCTTSKGESLAYAIVGNGQPLVKAANWLSHLQYDWNSLVWRHWLDALAQHYTLVRYDERGCGLSDWDVEDFSFEAWVKDLELVVAATGLKRFALLGVSQGGAVAVAYAVRHPEKVSHLILYGAYARGKMKRNLSEQQRKEIETMHNLIEIGWGKENPAFRQVFSSLFMPGGTPEQLGAFNELQRVTTSPENAAKIVRGFGHIDVRDLATQVTAPTLVLHAAGDLRIPFEEGRLLAGLIPNARFVPLESNNHILLEHEPAWEQFLTEVYRFTGVETLDIDRNGATSFLTPSEPARVVSTGLRVEAPSAEPQPGQEQDSTGQVSILQETHAEVSLPVVHNLPQQPTPFIGREKELGEVQRLLLEDPVCRLLTLLGPGGIGKTRLALEAAASVGKGFVDGVYFVPLAPLNSAENILSELAERIGFQMYTTDERQKQMLDYLRERELLLLMDNFEHVLEGAGLVADILENAPGVKILATSRERLNIAGETVKMLAGMRYPELASSGDLLEYEAVKLLLQSARLLQPRLKPSSDELQAIARICQLVHGMPLALVLAAGWLEVLSFGEIADEIAQSLDFLETEMRNVPERQRSVRAVFDYSWQLLSAEYQRAFIKLCVFRGGFTRQTAQQAAGASIRTLLALANKSWLQRDANGRYQIHELLRQYGLEKLKADEALWHKAHEKHSQYYVDWLDDLESKRRGSQQREALEEIASEFENIRAAWQWLIDHDQVAASARHLLPALIRYSVVFTRSSDLLKMLDAARQKLPTKGLEDEQREVLAILLTAKSSFYRNGYPVRFETFGMLVPAYEQELRQAWSLTGTPETLQAIGLWGVGLSYTYGRIIDLQAGINNLRELLSYFRQADRQWELAFGLVHLVYLLQLGYSDESDDGEMEEILSEAQSLFQELGDDREYGFVMRAYGQLRRFQHRYPEAIRCWRIAQEKFLVAGDWGLVADINWQLGDLHLQMGEFEAAFQAYRAASQAYLDRGHNRMAALVLSKESYEALRYSDIDHAMRTRQRNLAIVRQAGDIFSQAWGTWELGEIYRVTGDYTRAQHSYEDAKRLFDQFDDRNGYIFYHRGLGDIALASGDYEEAKSQFANSLEYACEADHDWGMSYAQTGLGQAETGLEHFETACEYFLEALRSAKKADERGITLLALAGLAGLYAATGQARRAYELATLVADHHVSWRETKSKAAAVIEATSGILSSEDRAAVLDQEHPEDLWKKVERIIDELSPSRVG